MQIVTWKKVIDAKTAATTVAVNSDPIDASKLRAISFHASIISGTTPSVGMVYQIINSGQEDASLIAGAVDGGGLEANKSWITPNTNGTLIAAGGLTTGSVADGFAPVASEWIRLRVTGSGTNGADTVVTVWVCIVEETSAIR